MSTGAVDSIFFDDDGRGFDLVGALALQRTGIGRAESAVTFAVNVVHTDITSLVITADVPAGAVELECVLKAYAAVAGTTTYVTLVEDGVEYGALAGCTSSTTNAVGSLTGRTIRVVTAGTHTWKLRAYTVGGPSATIFNGAGDTPASMMPGLFTARLA